VAPAPRNRVYDEAVRQALVVLWEAGDRVCGKRLKVMMQPGADRWWKTRADPFAHAWPMVEQWLMREPTVTAKELLARLASAVPDAYAGTSQLRTLQRRVQQWRAEQAKNLVLGSLELARLSA
jgi:hypothetical protein